MAGGHQEGHGDLRVPTPMPELQRDPCWPSLLSSYGSIWHGFALL